MVFSALQSWYPNTYRRIYLCLLKYIQRKLNNPANYIITLARLLYYILKEKQVNLSSQRLKKSVNCRYSLEILNMLTSETVPREKIRPDSFCNNMKLNSPILIAVSNCDFKERSINGPYSSFPISRFEIRFWGIMAAF